MKLTTDQLSEINTYVLGIPSYRETYYEIYDHVVNALEDKTDSYSIELVKHIIDTDFGGQEHIVDQEKIYQTEITRKYRNSFFMEVLKEFKFPNIFKTLILLALCIVFYQSNLNSHMNYKPLAIAVFILIHLPGVFYLFKRYVSDRNAPKTSIKYDFLYKMYMQSYIIHNVVIYGFLSSESFFELSKQNKNTLLIFLFFTMSIYIRSYVKLYNEKIKVLAV